MTRVREYTDADRARWDAYVRRSPASHFGQLIAWRDVTHASYGVQPRYWLAEDESGIRGVLPLFEKRGREPQLFSAPGGMLADDESVAAALLAPAREQVLREKLLWLELRDQKTKWADLPSNDEHVTMVLELAESPEVQWKAFDAKLRNQIRKGEKAGFVRTWGREQVAVFHRVLLENMRDLGTPIRDARYYARAVQELGDMADLLVIARDGDPAGVMFTVLHADTMMDPWASSLRRHFKDCPNQVLYWEALQRAFARGAKRFDFGRSQWESGTFLFKQQWGAKPVPLHYQYVLGTAERFPTLHDQKGSFDAAVKLWKKLPLPLARVFGEPAKRLFPEVL